jgi:hypothetical protein
VKTSFFLQILWRQNVYGSTKNRMCGLYNFYISAAVRRKFRNLYHGHYHQTPGENSILPRSQKFKEKASMFEYL